MGSSTGDLSERAQQGEDEEEELRMLASLKRQQEEEEVVTCDSGFSASQVGEHTHTHKQMFLLLYYICDRLKCYTSC